MKYLILFAVLSLTQSVISADAPPRITHEPVKAAVRGQPVYIRASIKDDAGPIKEANLYCSASSDSAPFKVPMRPSGVGSFIGTIPDTLAQNASQIAYYIEAIDVTEQSTETPWYTIEFRANQVTVQERTPSRTGETQKSKWKKPLLIAGGTAVAIGAGIAIADSGGGSSGDSGGTTPPPSREGLFSGSATRYFQLGTSAATSEVYNININVLDDDTITSDDLHPGARMEGTIVANSFNLAAPVNATDTEGQVFYNGTIVGDKITGTISGSVVTSGGTNGTYSGIFSANQQ